MMMMMMMMMMMIITTTTTITITTQNHNSTNICKRQFCAKYKDTNNFVIFPVGCI
jgi:hypothetical protein